MPKRPRFSRWRRLPGVYRFGEKARPEPNLEPQRLTLYLTWDQLDAAEALAKKAGSRTFQEYCAGLLGQAIDAERIRNQVADLEAHRGVLEGLHEIADDPEYLREWSAEVQAQTEARERSAAVRLDTPPPAPRVIALAPKAGEAESPSPRPEPGPEMTADPAEPVPAGAREVTPAGTLGGWTEVILRHAAQSNEEGPSFLATLRRGEPVAVAEIAELARALHELEKETREAGVLDRRLAYALHRLAFEAQVLHTDAWPGVFDEWTVDTLRAVQESVDRVLSGQDIRYDSPGSRLEIPR